MVVIFCLSRPSGIFPGHSNLVLFNVNSPRRIEQDFSKGLSLKKLLLIIYTENKVMIAAARLMHFFWSLKLGTVIMFNFLDALDEIL